MFECRFGARDSGVVVGWRASSGGSCCWMSSGKVDNLRLICH